MEEPLSLSPEVVEEKSRTQKEEEGEGGGCDRVKSRFALVSLSLATEAAAAVWFDSCISNK